LTAKIAKQFLEFPEVISAAKTFGEYVTDLKAEIIIKDNRQILRLVEAMKATPGVKNITWTEVIEEEKEKVCSRLCGRQPLRRS
jgi:DNA-binding Lrp family transcriptional regulator